MELIRELCLVCGYDLNPPDEKTMDATTSFIEMATFYLIDATSPLLKKQPEVCVLCIDVF